MKKVFHSDSAALLQCDLRVNASLNPLFSSASDFFKCEKPLQQKDFTQWNRDAPINSGNPVCYTARIINDRSITAMSYEKVNALWPEGTKDGRMLKPTPQEAISAARRLYRFVLKKKWTGKIKVTSGNRYSYIRGGVMYVNPDWRGSGNWHEGGGWHELVHMLSHSFAQRKYPNASGHGSLHAEVEYDMTEYVVKSGWLLGKLKRPEKASIDPKLAKRESVERRLKAWETKRKRAETALRKLRAQQRRYERENYPQAG